MGLRRRAPRGLAVSLRAARRAARRARRWSRLAVTDVAERATGRRDRLMPPRRLRLAGWRRRSQRMGEYWFRVLTDVGELRPDDDVLDIGCGPGWVAVPLTRYLDGGSYEGFDVSPRCVEWGQRRITKRHPRFRFQLADVRNPQYNPEGGQAASSYRFPYADGVFDMAFALSLFTHLRPEEIEHYLREVARVLRPGGRVVSTFFLLNDDTERSLAGREAKLRLEAELTDSAGRRYRGRNAEVPEHRIAVRETDVRAMYERAGLAVREARYGNWQGGPWGRQDVIVGVRR